MVQHYVTAIVCRNVIRVFKWEDFLHVPILIIIIRRIVSFIVYEYPSRSTSNPWENYFYKIYSSDLNH